MIFDSCYFIVIHVAVGSGHGSGVGVSGGDGVCLSVCLFPLL